MQMDIQPIDILKWIGIVLAAGFIGYFGRYLAKMLLAKLRKNETPPDAPREPVVIARPDEANLKLEKKRLKLEKKKAKKG